MKRTEFVTQKTARCSDEKDKKNTFLCADDAHTALQKRKVTHNTEG